jgi:type I restriction enzyme R subunit
VVAVDREACALYKEELDKYLPPDYSKVVYSPFYNDPPELSKYHLSQIEEKRIRNAFRRPDELPKILMVTEKLLTGFDAPILYGMYLDKPMRDHVLLQAIARVNRPYEDNEGRKKSSGFVLDFVGIFDNLEKALAFDSQDIEGIVQDIEVLKKRFVEEMKKARENYLILIEGKTQDKAFEAVLEHFRDEERRKEFYKFFKELSAIYEIISPDAFLRPYVDDYETLSRMYKSLIENYERGIPIDREFTRKTAMLVQEHTRSGVIGPTLDIYEIDEETLRRIEKSKASDTEKIFNLIKSIALTVEKGGGKSPYLISIAERAELIARLYESRQKTTQETLEELKKIIEEINSARREQVEKGMSADIFTIYWMIKERGFKEAEAIANEMREVLAKYPHWQKSERYEREVRSKLYEVILHLCPTDIPKVSEVVQNIMDILKAGSTE